MNYKSQKVKECWCKLKNRRLWLETVVLEIEFMQGLQLLLMTRSLGADPLEK